jgi:hypothetical protein
MAGTSVRDYTAPCSRAEGSAYYPTLPGSSTRDDAMLALLEGCTDIHILSRQMGNSAAMIERHYSNLATTMAAAKLA